MPPTPLLDSPIFSDSGLDAILDNDTSELHRCLCCGEYITYAPTSLLRNHALCQNCNKAYKRGKTWLLRHARYRDRERRLRDKQAARAIQLERQKKETQKRNAQKREEKQAKYKLWLARGSLLKCLRKTCLPHKKRARYKASLEAIRRSHDPYNLRECSACGSLLFVMDFHTKHGSKYPSHTCKECFKKQKNAQEKRFMKRKRKLKSVRVTLSVEERKRRASEAKKRHKAKVRSDPTQWINRRMSELVRAHARAFKQGKPAGGWKALVNYSSAELKEHLEKQFVDGMSWENYGEWHIDHIIPKSSFNIEAYGDSQFLACWALSNLQPLWAVDNIKKSNSMVFAPPKL